jgi:predicted transcriptional regulator
MPARRVTENSANRLTITLDEADRQELNRLSNERDRSLAWIVRDAIRDYLSAVVEARRKKAS